MFVNFEEDTHDDGENAENTEINVDLVVEMDVAQYPEILVE